MSRNPLPDAHTANPGDAAAVPPLLSPYPFRINPSLDALDDHNVRRGLQLYRSTSDPVFQKYQGEAYAKLVAYLYPTARLEELTVAHDIRLLLGCADDFFGHPSLIADRALMSKSIDQLLGVLADPDIAPTPPSHGALAQLTAMVWRGLLPVTSPSWRARLAAHLEEWFESFLWEADNLRDGTALSEETYKEGRRRTVAMDISLDLVDLAEHTSLPAAVTGSRIYRAYRDAVTESTIASADLGSLRKELETSDPHNLVLVVQNEYRITLQQAVDYVWAHLTSQLRCAQERQRMLLDFFPQHAEPLRRSCEATGSFLSGWIHWHAEWSRSPDLRPICLVPHLDPQEDAAHPHTPVVRPLAEE
ncbi:terpene synthase family protein [Saccharopolyspora shandongensis]|uniref:terpene synthase family protein n=1 Tax=Saccharopolyspora shandongensis TaxID=418495 RepID=UPI0033FD4BA5